ncbi:MAG TPA: GGDEF domain-containing protein [Burkholderiaceae bacterium]|nr:GGDEF domain-containing protein [Burkholderiaceae bacterium]
MSSVADHDIERSRLAECMRLADPAQNLDAAAAADAALEARELARMLASDQEAYCAAAWLARHWMHLGRMGEAFDVAAELLEQSVPPELEDARVEALRVITIAGSEMSRFERALAAADELVKLATLRGDAGKMLSAAVALAIPLERVGDSWQAERILSQALEEHGGEILNKDVMSAGNALCAVCAHIAHLLRHTGREAEVAAVLAKGRAAGERALRYVEQAPNPVYEVIVGVNLSETLIGQGEYPQALDLLRRLRTSAQDRQLTAFGRMIEINLAEVLVRLGNPREALEIVQAVTESDTGVAAAMLTKAHLVAYEAHKALADFEAALKHFELAERLERSVLTKHLRTQSELFVTRTEELRARHLATAARLEAQQERHRAAQFAAQAEQDPLTGLGNRRHLERRAAELFPALSLAQAPLALAQIDVDHFKRVNDTHGHAAGDLVLVALGALLRDSLRAADVVVRSGGEEFVLVLPDTQMAAAMEVCERLRARVEASPVDIGAGVALPITVSVGLAAAPSYDLDMLMRRADAALYAAKQAGRNRLWRADP